MAKKEVPLAELNAELKAYADNPDVKDAPTKAKINEFSGCASEQTDRAGV